MRFNYRVFNEESNIAIATLWTPTDQVIRALGDLVSKVCIIGNLYTPVGINHLLATLARYNRIDTLIIFGADINNVGELLIRFFRDGEVERLLIPRDVAEVVRSTVRVIDLRGAFRAGDYQSLINAVIRSYGSVRKPVRKSVVVNVEETPNKFNTPLMGAFIYENDAHRAWVKLVDLVLNFGFDGNNDGFREFLSPVITIDSRGREHPFRKLSKEAESTWFSRVKGLGDLLLGELRVNPRSLSAFIHNSDYLVQGIISGDYYNQFVYLRSLDVLNEWCREAQRWWFLGKYVVDSLNREFNAWYSMGFLTIVPLTARIAMKDLARAEDFVRRNALVFREFVEDPRGNFVITREGDSVVVEHRLPTTHELHSRFVFHSLEEAYNELKNSNYFTLQSHAMYLGKELARAFLTREYEQDKI
ncbi:DUF4346 domain-containing protein [Vulcanisaeta thermophila]|uniref:DUF4346 domain-containing protein n=1 Tax=Vulcanisaeta thermophila TaxID=867917 RepID=UPI0008538287|nr:thymidylate synthase [Vulcanisaeta thermophila]